MLFHGLLNNKTRIKKIKKVMLVKTNMTFLMQTVDKVPIILGTFF